MGLSNAFSQKKKFEFKTNPCLNRVEVRFGRVGMNEGEGVNREQMGGFTITDGEQQKDGREEGRYGGLT